MRVLALALTFMFAANASQAALVDKGDYIRDTGQHLEWLKLRATANMTYSQLSAGAGGFLAKGWRIAFGKEVEILFKGIAKKIPEFEIAHTKQFDKAVDFVNLFQCSFSFNIPGDCASYAESEDNPEYVYQVGIGGWYNDGNDANPKIGVGSFLARYYDAYPYNPISNIETIQWATFDDWGPANSFIKGYSVFLVKDSPYPASVPAPPPMLLLISGICATLVSVTRKKIPKR